LKRGWMPFWRSGSVLLAILVPLLTYASAALAQLRDAASKTRATPDAGSQRNELTLAGLRPGRDELAKALHVFAGHPAIGYGGASRTWRDQCRHQQLSVITDSDGTILQIQVSETTPDSRSKCNHPDAASASSRWVTGHGLVVGDSCSRVPALYGQPGTRSPSTKGGQQLELFYYAFDRAGPDVPQVMTVLCTPEKEQKPGRVVEITLAAPSL
jgi:hypothetical protein